MNNEMDGLYSIRDELTTTKLTILQTFPSPGPPTPSAMSRPWPTMSSLASGHSPP